MEKSVKNYSGRERILPALLLVMGLICASWISIQTGKKEFSETATPNQTVASDTTKKDKKNKKLKTNSTNPTKEMAIKNDEGSDHDMVEKSDGQDKASLEEPETLDDYHFAIPPVPDIEAIIPPVPDIDFMMDALEVPAIAWRNEEDWKEFSKEFEEQFKEKFEHFYQTNEKDIQQMIDDVQQKVASRLDEDWVERMHGSANKHQALALNHAKQRERHQDLLSRQTEHFKNAEERMKRRQEEHALHMREFEKNHELFEKKMKHFEESTKRLEEELRSELIKDGYLGEDEQLTNMHWNNGRIEINGKKIKSQDEKKYNELHEQFFKTH